MFLRVDSIYIPVANMDEAREFYAMKVGLPEFYEEDDFIGFTIGETKIIPMESDETDSSVNIGVVVESVKKSTEELEERGIEPERIIDQELGIDIVQFEDPFGNSWLLVEE